MSIFWLISLCAVCIQQGGAQTTVSRQAPNVTAGKIDYSTVPNSGWVTISQYNKFWTVYPAGFPIGSGPVIPGGPAAAVSGIALSLDTKGVVTFAVTAIHLTVPTMDALIRLPAKEIETPQRKQVGAAVLVTVCMPGG